jgi:hypothetical protein
LAPTELMKCVIESAYGIEAMRITGAV